MGWRPHVKPLGDPLQSHGRLASQQRGNSDLLRVALAAALEVVALPAEFIELLLRDAQRLGQVRLGDLFSPLPRAGLLADGSQQFLAELLAAQAPTVGLAVSRTFCPGAGLPLNRRTADGRPECPWEGPGKTLF